MTTEDLQTFAQEIGATLDFYPTRLTVKTTGGSVSVDVGMDKTITPRKIARLLTDKIDAVFCPSEDLLFLKERLERVQ